MLSPQDKDRLYKFGRTEDGELVKNQVEEVVRLLGDIESLDRDPVQSRRNAIEIVKNNLLCYLEDKKEVAEQEVENYE